MTTLKMRVGLATRVMRATMNEEYLKAKFDLCIDQAEKNIKEEEIAEAIKNLRRANSALSRLFGFEEEADE
jgi:CRISPR/Cas system CSM-associated protein Csm2 small subunit